MADKEFQKYLSAWHNKMGQVKDSFKESSEALKQEATGKADVEVIRGGKKSTESVKMEKPPSSKEVMQKLDRDSKLVHELPPIPTKQTPTGNLKKKEF